MFRHVVVVWRLKYKQRSMLHQVSANVCQGPFILKERRLNEGTKSKQIQANDKRKACYRKQSSAITICSRLAVKEKQKTLR